MFNGMSFCGVFTFWPFFITLSYGGLLNEWQYQSVVFYEIGNKIDFI